MAWGEQERPAETLVVKLTQDAGRRTQEVLAFRQDAGRRTQEVRRYD